MYVNDLHHALVLAHDHERRLRAEAAAMRLHVAAPIRHVVAIWLRRLADRLETPPFQPRTAQW